MKRERPVNLNVLSMRFPVTAIISIGHRITGVLIFFFLPMLLWMLGHVLSDASAYASMLHCLSQPSMRVLLWILLASVGYHIVAGLRHLLMDAHILSNSFTAGKISAWLVLFVAFLWAVFVGVWLW